MDAAPPDGACITDDDREIAEAIVQAVAGLRHRTTHSWRENVERLEDAGWTVSYRVGFITEARRGRLHETAAAHSRAEAFEDLWTLTLLDSSEGSP